jgi:NAD(P)-dependent dehydrogenase (short-subunit alcohol dehydrogenase family)
MSGGVQAAFGYRYQYLVTVEFFLRYLRDHIEDLASTVLHVEPTALAARGVVADDEIVDFAVEVADTVALTAQVKGSADPVGNEMFPGEARAVFTRLAPVGAPHAMVLTNRPLSTGLAAKCAESESAGEKWRQWSYVGDDEMSGANHESRIRVDERSIDELAAAIAALVREFRRDRHFSQGESTARLVSINLLYRIFGAAADADPGGLSALQIVELLSMPDAEVAHAVGSFDWGVPVTGIPTFTSTVPRVDQLNALFKSLAQPPDVTRPTVVVAHGQTGHGKSALAADFCHLFYNSFEFITWIDCSDPSLIEAKVRDVTERLTNTSIRHDADPSETFRGALASHRGPWLLVFDGAPHRHVIEKFVPTHGNGSILVTTVDETGWWPLAVHLPVETFTQVEAEQCFASYADLTMEEAASAAVADIVERLGRIPLAVSMAAMYFRNAAGTVDELSTDYFAQLDALEDFSAIPPGFNRTAFAAIEHAVRHLGDGRSAERRHDVQLAQAMLYRASLLAPDLLPLNYLIAAMPESGTLQLGLLPGPSVADAATRRRYITIFRTQSIAHRVLNVDGSGRTSETTETFEIHPLVHEILRNLFLRQIPRAELQFQLAIMMNVLHGWILHMRNRPDFFALDQLVSHADALMRTVGEFGELPTKSPKHNYMYHYTKIRLQLEVATCRMSRGDLNGAVNLARLALLDLRKLPRDAIRDAVTLEGVSAIVVDLSTAGADVETMRPFALMAERALKSCEWFGGNSARLAFEKAYLVRSFLNKRPEYRTDAAIATALVGINELISRDPSNELRPNVVMDQINQHIEDGNLDQTVPLVALLRQSTNAHDLVTVDCLEADIALRRNDYDLALLAIDNLIATELNSTHLAVPMSQGLGKIYQTLARLLADDTNLPPQLADLAEKVRHQVELLHARVLAEDSAQAEDNNAGFAKKSADTTPASNIDAYADQVYEANRALGL